jgi:hypothetical protein
VAAPTTDNQALETFDNIAATAALKAVLPVVERLTETAAETQLPFLALPLVKQIFEGGANILEEQVAKELLLILVGAGVKIIITVQTDAEKSAYAKAEGATRAALLSKDPAAIAAAKKEMDNAANSIIHSDGWLVNHRE